MDFSTQIINMGCFFKRNMGTKIVLFLLKITDVGAKFGNLAKI